MATWLETCQQQLIRLEKTAVLVDKLDTLCGKTQTDLPAELLQKLAIEQQRLNNQLERLRANRFEVAVIGLEKAGKSALLNAWLGQEILPSARERCTFTSTEIWSAQTEHDQLLRIEYYSKEEIGILQTQRRDALASNLLSEKEKKEIQEDLDDTEKHLDAIAEFTKLKSGFSQTFIDISEISHHLQEAIFKNRAQSLAIKRIQLKTVRLRSDRDIIFHDVPGFNSGILMHAEQALERLKKCDAIIYAKEMKQPSITGPEKEMLIVTDAEDPAIRVADKVFVVLTQVDALDDPIDFKETYEKHKNYWPAVPERRLIPVCARAHLVEFGIPSEDTLRRSKSADDKAKLKKLGITDGLPILKESVNYYIDNERALVLQKRCDALVNNMRYYASDILQKLEPLYASFADSDSDSHEDNLLGKEFNQWWGREWQRIKKDFDVWYSESIQGRTEADALGAEHQELAALHDAYDEKIEALLANLSTAQPDELKRIYTAGGTISMPDSREGNYKIREELFREIQQKFETELTDELAQALQALIDQIVRKTQELLWETEDVRKTLLHSQMDEAIEQARIRHGFQVLFLRFGRVAVEAFIAKPLQARERLLNERAAEIKTLEAFYLSTNDQPKQEGRLTHYLRYGLWEKAISRIPVAVSKAARAAKAGSELAETVADAALAVSGRGSRSKAVVVQEVVESVAAFKEELERSPEPINFEQVVEEINGDLAALEDYLKNSVFYAAGFITYCNQELERIRNRFKEIEDNERQWIGIIRTAVKYERNPRIPYNISHSKRDFRLRREIALELREVRDSYTHLY
ncbi:dynamin family protein [Methylovulum psychrotolerans]|uniref:dynamin family protein n=1 Tax=Methylovulum psychrotolerans TaxID=1704499 RepID=UPI001BFFBEAE|nr:dynamin family protein [Methylovulum psychrotolerans]MBT9097698.1 dynamin family protein [Methylovulum psychrotolerans]